MRGTGKAAKQRYDIKVHGGGRKKVNNLGTIHNIGHTSEGPSQGLGSLVECPPKGVWIPNPFHLSMFTGKERSSSPRALLRQKTPRCQWRGQWGPGRSPASTVSPASPPPAVSEVVCVHLINWSRTKNRQGKQDKWNTLKRRIENEWNCPVGERHRKCCSITYFCRLRAWEGRNKPVRSSPPITKTPSDTILNLVHSNKFRTHIPGLRQSYKPAAHPFFKEPGKIINFS